MKGKINMLLCGSALLLFGACSQPSETTVAGNGNDKAAEMKARFNQVIECFNTGKTEAIDTLLSANAKDHSADTAMHMPDGPAGLKQMIAGMRTGSPDLKTDVKHMAVDGDILLAYGSMSGTNTGPMYGMPPTNRAWSSTFCDVIKFGSDMKMTDHWGVYDEMKMMKDLGLIPSQPPPSAMAKPAATPEKK